MPVAGAGENTRIFTGSGSSQKVRHRLHNTVLQIYILMIFPFIVQVSSEDGLSEYGEEPAGVSIWQVGQLREEDRDSPRLRQSWAHDNTAATT